ncbi:MAG TPA: hypothetical protein VGL00_22150 [Terracidiphilus sp.]|jgi:hypothetical protein
MRALSSAELLRLWEQGLEQTSVDRALALLGTASQDCPEEDPAQFSVGRRDARLLALREQTFGPEIQAVARCTRCGQESELRFQANEVRVDPREPTSQPMSLTDGGYSLKFRLPNSQDLRAAREARNGVAEALQLLLRRCVLESRLGEAEVSAQELPDSVVAAISARMAEADPQAEVELTLACPTCQHEWQERFEIESFFWAEIHAWAGRALREVHQLASAYGWSEAEIMAVSPLRRSLYLNLIAE